MAEDSFSTSGCVNLVYWPMVDGGTASVWENNFENCHYFWCTECTEMTCFSLNYWHHAGFIFFMHIMLYYLSLLKFNYDMSLDNITQLTIVSGLHHTIQNREIWRSECDVYCMRPWAIAQTMIEHFSSQNTVYRMLQWLSVPFKFPKESLSTFVISPHLCKLCQHKYESVNLFQLRLWLRSKMGLELVNLLHFHESVHTLHFSESIPNKCSMCQLWPRKFLNGIFIF